MELSTRDSRELLNINFDRVSVKKRMFSLQRVILYLLRADEPLSGSCTEGFRRIQNFGEQTAWSALTVIGRCWANRALRKIWAQSFGMTGLGMDYGMV